MPSMTHPVVLTCVTVWLVLSDIFRLRAALGIDALPD